MHPGTVHPRQMSQEFSKLTKFFELIGHIWVEIQFCYPAEIVYMHFQWAGDPEKKCRDNNCSQWNLLPVNPRYSMIPQKTIWFHPNIKRTCIFWAGVVEFFAIVVIPSFVHLNPLSSRYMKPVENIWVGESYILILNIIVILIQVKQLCEITQYLFCCCLLSSFEYLNAEQFNNKIRSA